LPSVKLNSRKKEKSCARGMLINHPKYMVCFEDWLVGILWLNENQGILCTKIVIVDLRLDSILKMCKVNLCSTNVRLRNLRGH
jgi:hypothetical protein